MPEFHIFAQKRINSRSAELEKRTVGTEEAADAEIEALEEDGFEIADVHVYHARIGQQTTPARSKRGGRLYR